MPNESNGAEMKKQHRQMLAISLLAIVLLAVLLPVGLDENLLYC